MKKLLLIIFSLVFLLSNAIANDAFLDEFNEWLSKNGHYNYLNDPGAVIPEVCKEQKRFSNLWYYNKCDEIKSGNNFEVFLKFFFGSSGRTRTCDQLINSQLLYQLSYRGM